MSDAALGAAVDRFQPSIARLTSGAVIMTPVSLATSTQRLDFCQALRASMNNVSNSGFLHYVSSSGAVTHVSYALVDPGAVDMDLSGSPFDGRNRLSMGYESILRGGDSRYDDSVYVTFFDQLWESQSCSGMLATTGRAHPALESMLSLATQAFEDYATQMDIAVDVAYADRFSAGAAVASGASAVANAVGSGLTGASSAINKAGATSGAVIAATAAGVANGIATGLAAVALDKTIANHNDMKALRSDLSALVSNKLHPLSNSVRSNVQDSGRKAYSNE
jgi:hypothetical protein